MKQTITITCTEAARMLRKELKRHFPQTKFSVRSSIYAGGASISVNYTDGPSISDIAAITGQFAGSRSGRDEYGNEDIVTPKRLTMDGHQVTLYCDFVFVRRDLSDEARAKRDEALAAYWVPAEFADLPDYDQDKQRRRDEWAETKAFIGGEWGQGSLPRDADGVAQVTPIIEEARS